MSDESVCELLEVGLGMLARARLTEGLRNSAGACVQAITRAVFTRLRGLTPEDVDKLVAATQNVEDKQEEKKEKEEGETAPEEVVEEGSIVSRQSIEGKPEFLVARWRKLISQINPPCSFHTDYQQSWNFSEFSSHSSTHPTKLIRIQ